VPKQKPTKQKKTLVKQAKQGKAKQGKVKQAKTAKAVKPSKTKTPIKAAKPAKAKTARKPAKAAKSAKSAATSSKLGKSSKSAKASKPAKPSRPGKASKPIKAAKLAKRAKTTAKKASKVTKTQERSLAQGKRTERAEDRASKSLTPERTAAQLPMASRHMRIGLLGGSFNPAHSAHVEISLTALKRLGLDQVWWMVTPGNPLKDPSKLPSVAKRVAAAKRVASHPRIAVTGFAGGKGSAYTIDLLTELKRRFPGVNFVWLMGADNLAQFHRWRSWQKIFASMPIAVLDRPGFRLKARASQAGMRFQEFHVDESDASGLARLSPPAWTILTHRLSHLSSTKLRAEKKGGAKDTRGKKKS
jgi:nicotinate-nucleotide adenylyltransferase